MEEKLLTPSQRAKKKYYEAHKKSDDYYFQELRDNLNGWVPIKWDTSYEINRDGEVYFKGGYTSNGKRRRSQFVAKTLGDKGYYIVHLNKKVYLLHRLIAETFIPNPNNLPEVDHIDGTRQNNSISNLRWVTHKENLNNPVAIQREIDSHTGKTGKYCHNSVSITQLDLDGNYIREWDSMADVTRELGISTGNICSCCQGKYKTAGGYIWKYNQSPQIELKGVNTILII